MSDGCGASAYGLLRLSAQKCLWLKIPRAFSLMIEAARSTPYSGRCPRSGTMLNGTLSPLPPLVPRIEGTDFLSSPGGIGSQSTRSKTSVFASAAETGGAAGATDTRESVRASRKARPRILNWSIGSGELLPTPTASEGKFSLVGNSQRSKCLNALAIGKLNPEFPEWLMGFPIGWTDCDALEMQSSRRLRRSSAGASSRRSVDA